MSNIAPEPEYEQAFGGQHSINRSRLAWLMYTAIDLLSALENSSLFEKHPEYRRALSVVAVPERVIQFRVVWEDVMSPARKRCCSLTELSKRALKSIFCSSAQKTLTQIY